MPGQWVIYKDHRNKIIKKVWQENGKETMRIDIPSDFVKAGQNIQQGDIVQLLDEGKWGTFTARDGKSRKVLRFQMKLDNGEVKGYTMNKTTMGNLTDAYGKDSKGWINKDLKAHVVTMMSFGKPTKVLFLTPPHWDSSEQPKEVSPEPLTTDTNIDQTGRPEGWDDIPVEGKDF